MLLKFPKNIQKLPKDNKTCQHLPKVYKSYRKLPTNYQMLPKVCESISAAIFVRCHLNLALYIRGGVVQDFFRVGKILQVKINVTIDKNHGYKKIFWKFHLFNPPPGVWKFENPHYRVKNESCRKLYIWVSKPIRRTILNQRKNN